MVGIMQSVCTTVGCSCWTRPHQVAPLFGASVVGYTRRVDAHYILPEEGSNSTRLLQLFVVANKDTFSTRTLHVELLGFSFQLGRILWAPAPPLRVRVFSHLDILRLGLI